MKRLAIALIVLFVATTAFAGGKECNLQNHAAKSVALTGTLQTTGSGDDARTIFRVANSDQRYTVCEKTKASILKLTNQTLEVKGEIVSCGEGEELVIKSAKKI